MRIEIFGWIVVLRRALGRRPRWPDLYLRQGRVPAFVRADDPPAVADELAAMRRRQAMS